MYLVGVVMVYPEVGRLSFVGTKARGHFLFVLTVGAAIAGSFAATSAEDDDECADGDNGDESHTADNDPQDIGGAEHRHAAVRHVHSRHVYLRCRWNRDDI